MYIKLINKEKKSDGFWTRVNFDRTDFEPERLLIVYHYNLLN